MTKVANLIKTVVNRLNHQKDVAQSAATKAEIVLACAVLEKGAVSVDDIGKAVGHITKAKIACPRETNVLVNLQDNMMTLLKDVLEMMPEKK